MNVYCFSHGAPSMRTSCTKPSSTTSLPVHGSTTPERTASTSSSFFCRQRRASSSSGLLLVPPDVPCPQPPHRDMCLLVGHCRALPLFLLCATCQLTSAARLGPGAVQQNRRGCEIWEDSGAAVVLGVSGAAAVRRRLWAEAPATLMPLRLELQLAGLLRRMETSAT